MAFCRGMTRLSLLQFLHDCLGQIWNRIACHKISIVTFKLSFFFQCIMLVHCYAVSDIGHFPASLILSVAKYGSRSGIFYRLLFSAVPTACWIDFVQIWAKCDTYNVPVVSFTSLFTASIASPWTSFLHLEDGGTTLLRNLCVNLRLYTTSQPGRYVSSISVAKAWHPVCLLRDRNLIFKHFLLEIYLGGGGGEASLIWQSCADAVMFTEERVYDSLKYSSDVFCGCSSNITPDYILTV